MCFYLDPACLEAIKALKARLVTAPVLAHPHFKRPFLLATDACDKGLGAVLSQKVERGEQIVCCASRTLHINELKWTTHEKKL